MKHTRTNTEARSHFVVYGAVQGVGFRYFVRHAARALQLAGYVLNRADGAVEIEAEGAGDALRELLHTVKNGPPYGRVDRIESLEASTNALPLPFEIRR